jgi:NitT/TauT family transport system permease protein
MSQISEGADRREFTALMPAWVFGDSESHERIRRGLLNMLLPLCLVVGVVAIWSAAVRFFQIPNYLLPAPSEVIQQIQNNGPLFFKHSVATITVILSGFSISVVVAVAVAMLVVVNPIVERTVLPIIVGSQTIPKIAIAPLFVVWMGFGMQPKICLTFMISFFPILISTIAGLKAVENDMLDLVRSMGASSLKTVLRVRIPTALPQVFAGLKIGITSAVVGAIVAEFVGSDTGLGYLLLTNSATMDGPMVWAGLLILVVVGVFLYVAIAQAERIAIPWHVSIRSRGH